jgi:hypothetical protein
MSAKEEDVKMSIKEEPEEEEEEDDDLSKDPNWVKTPRMKKYSEIPNNEVKLYSSLFLPFFVVFAIPFILTHCVFVVQLYLSMRFKCINVYSDTRDTLIRSPAIKSSPVGGTAGERKSITFTIHIIPLEIQIIRLILEYILCRCYSSLLANTIHNHLLSGMRL